ncbi:hypothetical protein ACFV0O_24240 [Kitasatospora sp. NPDC059577]|uniref:hypothetical protein n=1 Tax=unclassified Kitasatospora TaxID=2633591 RepID=UPI0036C637A2
MVFFNSADSTGRGEFWQNFNESNANPAKGIVASICELGFEGIPQAGDAVMTVHNVVPVNGQIAFRISIKRTDGSDWPNDLHYRVIYAIG